MTSSTTRPRARRSSTRFWPTRRVEPATGFGLGYRAVVAAAVLALLLLVAAALAIGPYRLPPRQLIAFLVAKATGAASPLSAPAETVLLQIRLPRVLAATAVGAALASSGAAYQSLFRNPLVSPDILGVSSGAACGAVIGIFLSLPIVGIEAASFAGGLAAVAIAYGIATAIRGHDMVLVLVLAGVVIGALFGAGVGLLKYLADPYNQLPAITFWLLGSLAAADARDLASLLPAVTIGLVPLALLRWRIDVITLGDEEATALGLDTRMLRITVIAAATLMTATAVAASGIIGWVGLVVPHLARLIVGPAFTRLLPVSALFGASYLLAVDTVARTIGSVELPLGVLTAALGTPVFLWLLAFGRRPGVVVSGAPLLAVDRLSYGYPGRRIGQDVSLAVDRGEVLCVLGRNGEGKSTLFKTVLGLLPPLAGTVRVEGEPTAGWHPRRRATTFGWVPQSGAAAFAFTVGEIVLMGRTAHRGPLAAPSAADHDAVARAIATLGIEHLAARDWLRVSGGERQLALIARALAQESRILVLDEPTASLDFGNQVRVLDAVRRLAESRALAVLLSTHHPEQAFACADKVAVLADGHLLRLGPPAEVVTAETLNACYGVDVVVLPVAAGPYRACVPRAYLAEPLDSPAHSG